MSAGVRGRLLGPRGSRVLWGCMGVYFHEDVAVRGFRAEKSRGLGIVGFGGLDLGSGKDQGNENPSK